MPEIITEQKAPYIQRKIQCPAHWLVDPREDVYLREPVAELKYCSDQVELKGRLIKIRKTRIKKDAFGRKLVDWKKLYELRKIGKVLHPMVTAAWAIENVYDPTSIVCLHCKGRCKDGMGTIKTFSIGRLIGKLMKRK